MSPRFRSKLNYSNVIASLALFVALGGVAVAAGLPRNSVGPKQLKRGAVTAVKLRNGAVTSVKIARGAVIPGKIGPNAVGTGNIGNGVITSAKLAKSSVINATIANGVVGTNKLGNEVVTSAKLAKEAVTTDKLDNGSVTAAKLNSEIGPLLGTLRSGQTLRGVFYVKFISGVAPEFGSDSVSYPFPISGNPPAVTVLKKGQTNANCAGIGSGSAPSATAGNLCVYLTEEVNLDETTPLEAFNNQRLGFGLAAKSKEAGEAVAYGQWAVTAP
ncbi:MAG: hypothetical protein WD827_05715 [Solirubrobacterales bacterium]